MSGPSLFRSFVLGLSLLAFSAAAWPIEVSAQEPGEVTTRKPPVRGPGGVGGTSLTLRDVWGPAEMPPAPKDFGPHFDFPPEALGGGLTHDPYPN
jgi:hypothetical protein